MQDLLRTHYLVSGYWKLCFDSNPINNLVQIVALYYYIRDFLCQTKGSPWQYLQFIEKSMTAIWAKSTSQARPQLVTNEDIDKPYPHHWTMYNKLSLTPINCSEIKYFVNYSLNKSINHNTCIGFTNNLRITNTPHITHWWNLTNSWNNNEIYAGFELFPSPNISKLNHTPYFIRKLTIINKKAIGSDDNKSDDDNLERWNYVKPRFGTNCKAKKDLNFYRKYPKESHRVYGQMMIKLTKQGGNYFRHYYTLQLRITENKDHCDILEYSFTYPKPLKDINFTISAPNEAIFSLQHVDIGFTPISE